MVSGQFPEDGPAALTEALRAVASRTEQVRANDILLSSPAEVVFAGRIAEVSDRFVLLVQVKGTATMVPLWMAGAARRDRVGDFLALVADKLDGASAVVEAVPAIDIDDTPGADGFSPFGRGDARTRSITADDVRLLAGDPQSLRDPRPGDDRRMTGAGWHIRPGSSADRELLIFRLRTRRFGGRRRPST